MAIYVLGLGSSLGEPFSRLALAVSCLSAPSWARLCGRSRIYLSPPAGGRATQPFANAAVALEWSKGPLELLEHAKDCERRLGRQVSARWSDRAIDVDLLWSSGGVVEQPNLEIPHPQLLERSFALWPLVEAWPEAVDPSGVTYRQRLAQMRAPAAIGVLAP